MLDLIKGLRDVRYKNRLWRRVRKSYSRLYKYFLVIEAYAKLPASEQTQAYANDLFAKMAYEYSLVIAARSGFDRLLIGDWAAPTKLELSIYAEYCSAAIYRKDRCLDILNSLNAK